METAYAAVASGSADDGNEAEFAATDGIGAPLEEIELRSRFQRSTLMMTKTIAMSSLRLWVMSKFLGRDQSCDGRRENEAIAIAIPYRL
mmetsp:Transcript_7465/g.16937  ORF Transcript_7465/g.16937 Transcript_7465/m.16937 type:complete len:89 (-) Transcript_7465:30-296(-)